MIKIPSLRLRSLPVLFYLVCLQGSCTVSSSEIPAGGSCEYERTPGFAIVRSLTPTYDSAAMRVTIDFVSEGSDTLRNEVVFIRNDCIRRLDVGEGRLLGAIRDSLTHGVCTPLRYRFPLLDSLCSPPYDSQ